MRILCLKWLVAAALLLLVLLFTVVPRLISGKFENLVSEDCESCSVTVDRTRLSFFPFSVLLEGVHFRGWDPKATGLEADVAGVRATIAVFRLLKGEFHITKLLVDSPVVVVTEGDLKTPLSKSGASGEKRKIKFVIEAIRIKNGSFTYVRDYPEPGAETRHAALHVKDIQGTIGPVGNTPPLLERTVLAEVQGRLENSGHFILTVERPVFLKEFQLAVRLQLSDQNLGDLSPFFQASGGIKLKGSLLAGESSTQIREEKLNGRVKARYNGLSVQMKKTKDRGALAAFFANLVASTQFHPSDLKYRAGDQVRSVELKRRTDETILQFILRGMQDAALNVATQSR